MIIKCSPCNLMQFENIMCNKIDDYIGDEIDIDMLKLELKNEFKTFIIYCANNAETYIVDMMNRSDIEDEEI